MSPDISATFLDPMSGKQVAWEHDHVFNPAAITFRGKVYLLYRAEDSSGSGIGGHTSRIGLAESTDGIHFRKRPAPVLYPDDDGEKKNDWTGGCEDPRVVQGPDGVFVLTYTAWNHNTARLSVATSKDLIHWKKRGPAFAETRYRLGWSKSGSIVTRIDHGQLAAGKIDGKFWMYWGDGELKIASSTNLINWDPYYSDAKLSVVMKPRPGKFDSLLVEPGPPALLTPKGIVLIYNGENDPEHGDPSIKGGMYSAGQALFDPHHPERLLDRSDSYFLRTEGSKEVTGQYQAGTVFTEGLARFKGQWFLYYGSADSYVGLVAAR